MVCRGISAALQHYQTKAMQHIKEQHDALSLEFLAACINNGHRCMCLCDEMIESKNLKDEVILAEFERVSGSFAVLAKHSCSAFVSRFMTDLAEEAPT